MNITKLILTSTFAALFTLSVGMAHAGDADFEDFGGKAGMTKIVDDFMVNVLSDPRIKDKFAKTNIPGLKYMLTEQFCELTGGPCKYPGRDMKTAHAGMGVNNAMFDALAEDLQIAMEKAGVPQSAQFRLVAKLAPMQHDIVTK